MKNNNLRLILGIVGGIVVVAAIAVALIHFWDELKKLLPGGKKQDELDEDFEELLD